MVDDLTPTTSTGESKQLPTKNDLKNDEHRKGNPSSHHEKLSQLPKDDAETSSSSLFAYNQLRDDDTASRSIHYSEEFHKEYEDISLCESSDDCADDDDDDDGDDIDDEDYDNSEEIDDDMSDDLTNLCPKYLIFSTGSKTYAPHQIGFKRVRNISFPKKLEPGPSLKERIAAKEREKIQQVHHFIYEI